MQLFSRSECISFAILSSILSSVGTLFKVKGVSTVPPVLAATLGVLFAGLLSIPYLFLRGELPSLANIRKVKRPLVFIILCRPVISNVLFTIGLSLSTGVKAVFLTKMEPYVVIFWIWALEGKRPSRRHLGLLFFHIGGAILLSIGDLRTLQQGAVWGDLIIVTAVITAALSYRYAPQVTKVLSATQTATITETIGGLVTLPLALALTPLTYDILQQTGWIYIAIHSILFYVLAIPLLYASLHGIDGWISSALRATGPLVAVPIAWAFFGEKLTLLQICGGIIVLITSALVSRAERKSTSLKIESSDTTV